MFCYEPLLDLMAATNRFDYVTALPVMIIFNR
ncbi:hypothetical protein BN439_2391 [Erwinia amylovora Ea644]|nr:hypothetical protein BN439_2391 [Erwinia amylovora Ea644]CCP07467.1 hypothetical protein BN440_2446 [Erwinia amylovora MR1]